MYFCYILKSESLEKYYVGVTGNLQDRLRRHLANHSGFTHSAADWNLVWSESFATKVEAIAREKQIKKWKSKLMIEKLIAQK